MHKVHYGNERYHQYQQMMDWCQANIGIGGWKYGPPIEGAVWLIGIMFGQSTFAFERQEDADKFREQWDIK